MFAASLLLTIGCGGRPTAVLKSAEGDNEGAFKGVVEAKCDVTNAVVRLKNSKWQVR